jgi:hypothetical protein
MKQARHLLLLALCCLFSVSLMAQDTNQDPVYQVNLGNISNINLTLNENCEALLIPEMVLTGDRDVDGNGDPAPWNLFKVTVMDGNPANGAMIDGCGTFDYKVEAMDEVMVTEPIDGFEDGLAGGSGEFFQLYSFNDASIFQTGFFSEVSNDRITFEADGDEFILFPDPPFFIGFGADFFQAGEVSFSYDFDNADVDFDFGYILYSFEGEFLDQEVANFGPGFEGDATLEVTPGDFVEFGYFDDGVSSFNGLSVFSVFDWSFDPIDIVFPVEGLHHLLGYGKCRRQDGSQRSIYARRR